MANPFRRLVFHRQIVVNLDDGTTIAGVLFQQAGPLLVLKNAHLVASNAEPVPLDGDVIVERSRVVFIQAP